MIPIVSEAWESLKSNFYRHSPNWLYGPIASAFFVLSPNRRGVLIYPSGLGEWVCVDLRSKERLYMHNPHIYPSVLVEKYTKDGFVELQPDDTVFDVGARTGTFSYFAADRVNKVIAIEPAPENLSILRKTARSKHNIVVVPKAAWNRKENRTLHLSESPSGHSLLDLDLGFRGGTVGTMEVEADTIDNISVGLGIDTIDFLKIDAEGAEPEVLEGVQDTTVRKIAVDCVQGPEESGDWTEDEVISLLQERGYEVRTGGSKNARVYARR